MKYLLFIIPFLYSSVISAQTVQVSPIGNSADNNLRTFTFDRSNIELRGTDLSVSGPSAQFEIPSVNSYSRSDDGRFIAVIMAEDDLRAWLIDGLGNRIRDIRLDYFDPSDETLKIKVYNDGSFTTRDNVANFSFFDSEGTLKFSVSNSSGSPEGEVASGIATDSSGNTILLYNPRINYGSNEGSRARILREEDNFIDLFESRNRIIKKAVVSKKGSYITLITERAGASDEVIITDRFGNEIVRFDTDMDLAGSTLTEEAGYLTLYSSNRAQVYRLSDRELLGSTSFSVSVVYAAYCPEDQQILALIGSAGEHNRIQNPELHAIHLGERSIARTDIAFPLSFIALNNLQLKCTADNQFLITGLNRELSIQTQF